ncbi:unnamed protein product [Orchesella dallaii]|uniref:Uncharacterized protein n=1 Tax=Orchesella dallaii TaxID=48710 RepID=A0ABP1QJW5_9HEXA
MLLAFAIFLPLAFNFNDLDLGNSEMCDHNQKCDGQIVPGPRWILTWGILFMWPGDPLEFCFHPCGDLYSYLVFQNLGIQASNTRLNCMGKPLGREGKPASMSSAFVRHVLYTVTVLKVYFYQRCFLFDKGP